MTAQLAATDAADPPPRCPTCGAVLEEGYGANDALYLFCPDDLCGYVARAEEEP
jgi:hypothetical protein